MAVRKKHSTAKRGGGPTSVEGRARSSQNSTVHGCTSKKLLMPGESAEDYRQCSGMWFERFQANSQAEVYLIQQVVDADWRARRSERTLTAFEFELHQQEPNPVRWTDEQMRRLGLFKRYFMTDNNAFEKALKLVEHLRQAERQEGAANTRMVDRVMVDFGKPKAFHEARDRAVKALDEKELPNKRTDGGCECPPCLQAWVVVEWKKRMLETLTPASSVSDDRKPEVV